MSSAISRYRAPGLALCRLALGPLALAALSGCAHFRDAEARADRERAGPTAVAQALPATAAVPAPPPLPPAVQPVAAPPTRAAQVAAVETPTAAVPAPPNVPRAPPPPAPAVPVDLPAAPAPPPPPPPAVPVDLPAAPTPPPPRTPPPPPPAVPVDLPDAPAATTPAAPAAPATANAIIIVANVPGARCGDCATLKISVAPSGQVLIERGQWAGGNRNWRYKRSVVHVDPARATAFAASLGDDRPTGAQLRPDAAPCAGGAAGSDGLVVEWIEAERHDTLTVPPGCAAGQSSPLAQRLRVATSALGLRGLIWPDAAGQP